VFGRSEPRRKSQHALGTRRKLLQQLEQLGSQLVAVVGETGHVAARARKVGDQADALRTSASRHHDRERLRLAVQGLRRKHDVGHCDIRFETEQLASEIGQALRPVVAPAHFEAVVALLSVAEFLQSVAQGVETRTVHDFRPVHQHDDQRWPWLRESACAGKSSAQAQEPFTRGVHLGSLGNAASAALPDSP